MLSSSHTSHGAVLGTLGYMAPEQVRGQTVDGRADVFAFGAILYEMLSGCRAFSGATAADVVSAILDKDRLPLADREIPSSLARIVDRCLEKSADARFQSTRDLAFALETLDTSSSAAAAAASVPTQSARARAWKLLAGTAALAAIGLAWPATLYLRRGATEPVVTRLDVVTPPSPDPYALALSPDGRQLVFAVASGGRSQLWVRSFGETAARPLAGTEGGRVPFWSPDGRAIGFFADAKLKVIDLAGGMPRVLADAPGGAGGTWNRDGVILFAPFGLGGLMRAAAGGGSVAPVTQLSADQGSHRFPSFLPDGRRFLFVSVLGRPETDGLFVGSLDSSPPTRVLDTGVKAAYASPGYLLLVAQGTLVAYPFDAARGIVSGERMPVAQPVGNDGPHGAFAVSETGVLAYRNVDERRQLIWADRAGKVLPALPPDEAYQLFPEIGPRGLIAVNRVVQGNFDVWLIDLARGGASRFTAHPAFDNDAVWSPDGTRLAFASSRNGHRDRFVKPTAAATDEQLLLASEQDKAPQDWSPDGRVLLYASQDPKTSSDLWVLPLDPSPPGPISSRSQKPFAIAQTTFDEIRKAFPTAGGSGLRLERGRALRGLTFGLFPDLGKTAGLSEVEGISTAVATRVTSCSTLQRTVE
jgi:Tol biopolymer transport system component